MMANSARDPYWHAGVRREVTDHPQAQAAIEDKCSTCHMPMARTTAAAHGGMGQVFVNLPVLAEQLPDWDETSASLAADGVSCTVCHQIRPDNFGLEESFDGGYSIDATATERVLYGPHDVDAGRQHLMNSAGNLRPTVSTHMQRSELCATCHTLFTQALDENGEQVGELPEQVPYLEWQHSDYRTTQSCQDCHMPEVDEDIAITSVLGQPRPNFSQHVFRGANSFMLGILNKYRGELGVKALPQEFAATIRRTQQFLGNDTARVRIASASRSGGTLRFDVDIESLTGHKLPTAYPSRRVWLHVTVTAADGRTVFESGAFRPDGSIVGNDNDEDAMRFEPHYDEITAPGQVQIYEPILVDSNDRVTTGLIFGVRYIKDNRLLPRGFDKTTADPDVGVFGAAFEDDDFVAGGDSIRYRLNVGNAGAAALTIEAELLYQTIGFRWAENLKAYRSAETDRFVRYYGESVEGSAVRLAVDSQVLD